MKYDHETRPRPLRVAEPVQVYLRGDEKDRLDRLTAQLDTTKSEVLRKGLEALERQVTDPDHHPALGVIGIAGSTQQPSPSEPDVARDHDHYLSDTEVESWKSSEKDD